MRAICLVVAICLILVAVLYYAAAGTLKAAVHSLIANMSALNPFRALQSVGAAGMSGILIIVLVTTVSGYKFGWWFSLPVGVIICGAAGGMSWKEILITVLVTTVSGYTFGWWFSLSVGVIICGLWWLLLFA